jgi:hypothetical protein
MYTGWSLACKSATLNFNAQGLNEIVDEQSNSGIQTLREIVKVRTFSN